MWPRNKRSSAMRVGWDVECAPDAPARAHRSSRRRQGGGLAEVGPPSSGAVLIGLGVGGQARRRKRLVGLRSVGAAGHFGAPSICPAARSRAARSASAGPDIGFSGQADPGCLSRGRLALSAPPDARAAAALSCLRASGPALHPPSIAAIFPLSAARLARARSLPPLRRAA